MPRLSSKYQRTLPLGAIQGHQPNSAFASFSGRDRKDVLGRVQGITKVCQDLDVFVDVLSLRSGQDWEVQIPGARCVFPFLVVSPQPSANRLSCLVFASWLPGALEGSC